MASFWASAAGRSMMKMATGNAGMMATTLTMTAAAASTMMTDGSDWPSPLSSRLSYCEANQSKNDPARTRLQEAYNQKNPKVNLKPRVSLLSFRTVDVVLECVCKCWFTIR